MWLNLHFDTKDFAWVKLNISGIILKISSVGDEVSSREIGLVQRLPKDLVSHDSLCINVVFVENLDVFVDSAQLVQEMVDESNVL